MTYYLNQIDRIILSSIKKGIISKREGQTLQDTAYGYDNIKFGYNWLCKRIDQLEMDY